MRHQTRIKVVSAAAGFGFAGLLQVAALLASQAGFGLLSRGVDWPTTLLQALIPGNTKVIFFAGFPLGGAVYSVLAYLIFRKALYDAD
jgi:hypothetical protein